MGLNGSREKLRIFAVVVLYKCRAGASPAFQSLRAAADRYPEVELKALIFDNSPEQFAAPALPPNFIYARMASNQGLSGPYNQVLAIAHSEGFEWLLTLDQDTTLPEDFLLTLSKIAIRLQHDESVAAIVPQMMSGD